MKAPLSLAAGLAATLTLPAAAAAPKDETAHSSALVYFGTYTGAKSKGIYVSRINTRSGEWPAPTLAAESASPSFLAVHPSRRFLYAVNEVSHFQNQKSGSVSAFSVDSKSGQLVLLNQQPSGGDGPCYLTVDASGKVVLVANYGGGSCALFPIDAHGHLGERTAFEQHQGSSVNRQRQEGPHAHGIYLDSSNRFAFVPDLGLDRIMIYRFDPTAGTLLANDPPFARVDPGSGPRHLAFHPTSNFAYVINEMLCTITAFRLKPERGLLESFQTISTLPSGQSVLSSYSTAEIEVDRSGRFLYGSNRGHNTIAVYAIDSSSGRLELIEHVPTQGKTPRGFGIDPTGNFLLAANQDSDNVMTFRIDQATGRLAPIGQPIEVGAPVCVKFLAPAP